MSKIKLFGYIFSLTVFMLLIAGFASPRVLAKIYKVKNVNQIYSKMSLLRPGDIMDIMPGTYPGGISFEGLKGNLGAPITIRGKDPENLPVFKGGNTAFNFSRCHHIRLKNLHVHGAKKNGISFHDGKTGEAQVPPSTNVYLERIYITDTGPEGNADAIKMSGVRSFNIRNCQIIGWGGSGIDMVGCAYGRVSRCFFKGKPGFSQGNGIQIKGGSQKILVEKCYFIQSGRRGINLGGSTGFQWFRPRVMDYEAQNIEVAGNVFIGGTAIGFVTSQRGYVHHNAILYPAGYVFRILQESEDPRFRPCGNSMFMNNIIVVDKRLRKFLNIGPHTAPRSFIFAQNVWYDTFSNRKPNLPSLEKNPVYQINPGLKIKNGRVFFLSQDHRLFGKGPNYYKHFN